MPPSYLKLNISKDGYYKFYSNNLLENSEFNFHFRLLDKETNKYLCSFHDGDSQYIEAGEYVLSISCTSNLLGGNLLGIVGMPYYEYVE